MRKSACGKRKKSDRSDSGKAEIAEARRLYEIADKEAEGATTQLHAVWGGSNSRIGQHVFAGAGLKAFPGDVYFLQWMEEIASLPKHQRPRNLEDALALAPQGSGELLAQYQGLKGDKRKIVDIEGELILNALIDGTELVAQKQERRGIYESIAAELFPRIAPEEGGDLFDNFQYEVGPAPEDPGGGRSFPRLEDYGF